MAPSIPADKNKGAEAKGFSFSPVDSCYSRLSLASSCDCICKAANGGRFQNKMREHTEEQFGFQGQDAIRMLEEQWTAYLRDIYDID
jgi:hypothetical protein